VAGSQTSRINSNKLGASGLQVHVILGCLKEKIQPDTLLAYTLLIEKPHDVHTITRPF
jgi:hypothetical protein